MFDQLIQNMVFGKKVTYKNEEYFIIHALEDDYYLAVKVTSDLPLQVYLIQIDDSNL